MKNLRILFMGTPAFAVHILDRIIANNYEVCGVVTAPDKPAGRGQKMHTSAVKKYAVKNNLPLLQPTNLKSEEFAAQLQEIKPDIAVVVAFRMLPKKVWSFPKHGTFNLHASLLPEYRGAAPINWAIINGEEETGVTTFFLDEEIDTGKIILQEKVAILAQDDAGKLHDKLMETGAETVVKTLAMIANDNIHPQPQPTTGKLKAAPKLNADNTQIDWTKDVQSIHNHIRGLNPYPVAWTILEDEGKKLRCKIFEVTSTKEEHDKQIGEIVLTKSEMKVATTDGYISIKKIQLPGKRKMLIQDLLNGIHLSKKAKMC